MDTALIWFKGLLAAFITGAATALTATQSCDVIGVPLNWHQISAVGLASGFYGALAFLKQNPVPPVPDSLEIPFRSSTPAVKSTDQIDK